MLNQKQINKISQGMSSFSHIPEINSPVFGEPFLDNGYIYYFDGSTLTFFPQRIAQKTDIESIKKTIIKIADIYQPKGIVIWGETPNSFEIKLKGYETHCNRKINMQKTEMRFFGNYLLSNKANNAMGKFKKQKMTLKFVKREFYLSEYLNLLTETHKNKIDSSNMPAYYAVYPLIKKIKFAELRTKENILAGVMIIYDNSPRYVCLAEIGYNKNIQRASDILFAAFLNEYSNKSEVISLGGSETEGIFRNKKHFFKKFKKWYEYPCYVLIEYKKKGSQWNDDCWIDKMRKK
jgi:hypothetical protein